jgi:cell division protein FtsW
MTARNLLIFCVVCLLCIGSVMVASASMPYAEYMHENPFHYVVRHAISIASAAVIAYLVYKVPLNLWFRNTFPLWLITIVLLLAVLVIGTSEWLQALDSIGRFTLQPTEVAKVMMAILPLIMWYAVPKKSVPIGKA